MAVRKRRVLFVINTRSGKRGGTDWKIEIEKKVSGTDLGVEFFFLPCGNAKEKYRDRLRQFRPSRVVAAGGDGTVNFVASELLHNRMELAILPAGSANGTAAEINLPGDPDKALELALNGTAKATDVIRINDQYLCLHLSDVGINAQLIRFFDEGRWRGFAGYGLALVKTLFMRNRISVQIEASREEVQRSAVMVIIANASKYGTGATINPQGNIHDGYLELIVVRRLGIRDVAKMFMRFSRFDDKRIEVIRARSVKLNTRHPVPFQIDGEYLGKIKEVKAQILPGSLRLVSNEMKDQGNRKGLADSLNSSYGC